MYPLEAWYPHVYFGISRKKVRRNVIHPSLLEIAQMVHHATLLPVHVYQGEDCLQSFPKPLNTADMLVGKPLHSPWMVQPEMHMLQQATSTYQEQVLSFGTDEAHWLCIGPFLTSTPSGADIVRVLKQHRLPIRQKDALLQYYAALPVLSAERVHYCGQLLTHLCSEAPVPEAYALATSSRVDPIKAYFNNIYKDRERMFVHPPFFLENKVSDAIRTGHLQAALETLREINRLERAVLALDPLRSLKNSVICSCTFFTRAAIAAGVAPDVAFAHSDVFIQGVEKLHAQEDVARFEEQILTRFVQLSRENIENPRSLLVVNAMRHIDENLTLPLSLNGIAAQVHVSPHYLSTRFKQETGQSMTAYIAAQRVREAAYFVAHSDYRIADIAQLYQFCNQSYFITVFKRVFHVVPGVYRAERNRNAVNNDTNR